MKMNENIKIMIELQKFADKIIKGKNEIVLCNKKIENWALELKNIESSLSSLKEIIKEHKAKTRQRELELNEKEEQAKKLEKRRLTIKTEKELKAIDNELNDVNQAKGNLEEELIFLFDENEQQEKDLKDLEIKLENSRKESDKDIMSLKEKINLNDNIVKENQGNFDELVVSLKAEVRAKFKKLIDSGNGKAIVETEDGSCGACHFKLPGNVAYDATQTDNIVTCTNCGRFIY